MRIKYSASGVLVLPQKQSEECLLAVYDQGYPFSYFREHFKFFGGLVKEGESVRGALEREVGEEFSLKGSGDGGAELERYLGVKSPQKIFSDKKFVSEEMISSLKRGILANSENPFRFIISIDENENGIPSYSYKTSICTSKIDCVLFDEVGLALKEGYRVVSECDAMVITFPELRLGDVRGAFGNASVLRDILKLEVPEYNFITCTKID